MTTNLYVAMNLTFADGTILVKTVPTDGTMKVICPTIPHPTVPAPEFIQGLFTDTPGVSVTVQEARDGTLIRMFYYDGQWVCATNYSLDLKTVNTRLNQTKPFQTMIEEAMTEVDLSFSDLDTGLIYYFMLEHQDNIIVLQHQRPNLSPVMTAKLTDTAPYYEIVDFCAAGLLQKTRMGSSCVDKSALSQLNTVTPQVVSQPVTRVGLIVNVLSNGSFTRFRLNTPEYDAAKTLLSTGVGKSFRCLQIMCKNKNAVTDAQLFKAVFPNYAEAFAEVERQVLKLCKVLKIFYKMTFVDDNDELVYGPFMKTLHRLDENTPVNVVASDDGDNKPTGISITAVRRYILKQDAALVAFLLNTLKTMESEYTSEEMDVVLAYD